MSTMPTLIKLQWNAEEFLSIFNDADEEDNEDYLPSDKLQNRDYFDDSSESDEDEM